MMSRILSILIIALITVSCENYNRTKYFSNAIKLNEEKKYEDAILLLNKVLENEPNEIYSLILRGRIKVKLEDFSGGLDDFNRAIQLKAIGQPLNEIESEIWDIDTTLKALRFERGNINYYLNDFIAAQKDFEYCIDLNYKPGDCYKRRCDIYEKHKNLPDGCTKIFKELMNLDSINKSANEINESSFQINNWILFEFEKLNVNGPVWLIAEKTYSAYPKNYPKLGGGYTIDSSSVHENYFEFNKNKQIIYLKSFDPKQEIKVYHFLDYTDNYITKTVFHSGDENNSLSRKYILDESNRIIRIEKSNTAGEQLCTDLFFYDDNNQVYKKWNPIFEDSTFYKFDSKNRIVNEIHQNTSVKGYSLTRRYENNRTYLKISDNSFLYSSVFTFDSHGNWIKEEKFQDGYPHAVTFREITYCE